MQATPTTAAIKWNPKIIYDDPTKLFSPKSPLEDATEWLKDELEDGVTDSKTIFSRGEEMGHSEKTLQRAKKKLGVRSIKMGLNSG